MEEIIFIMERKEFYCLWDFIVWWDILRSNDKKYELRRKLYKIEKEELDKRNF
jgi:hypothetical protein